MLVIALFSIYGLISLDPDRYYIGGMIMLYLVLIILIFGIIYSLILLFRRKPLLTVTNSQIIIYNILGKSSAVNFEDIKSFHVSNTTHRGIKTSEQINIFLKHPKENSSKKSVFSLYFTQHISVDILNVKTKVLLELLNDRLKNFKE